MSTAEPADITIHKSFDFCDLHCPHLIIAVIHAVQSVKTGQVIQIKATDLNAPSSISSWARQSGNPLLDMYEENGCFVFSLKCNQQKPIPLMEQDPIDELSTEG